MDELGPDEQRWLDALRAEGGPDHADRARVRASVLATLAAGTGATAAAGAGLGKAAGIAKAAGGTASLFAPWKIGIAVASLALVGGGITAVAVSTTKTAAPTTRVGAPSSTALSGPSVPEKTANTAAPAAPATTEGAEIPASPALGARPPSTASSRPERHAGVHPRAISSSQPRVREGDVDAELVILTEAQQALKRGDANAALAALGRHAREHPRGALAVEREGLRAIASCEAKREGGRALAERFVAQNPSSPLVARVRTACLSP